MGVEVIGVGARGSDARARSQPGGQRPAVPSAEASLGGELCALCGVGEM
jgi:hypothetical protein